jgi:hypothetical protein
MSYPLESPPYDHNYFGDLKDDDAQVLESLVEQHPSPPDPVVEPLIPQHVVTVKPQTRLVTTRIAVPTTGWSGATLLIPGDSNRVSLFIRVRGTSTDGVYLSDDPSKANSATSGFVQAGDFVKLDGHTGPVWIQAPLTAFGGIATNGATVSVDCWAVTQ